MYERPRNSAARWSSGSIEPLGMNFIITFTLRLHLNHENVSMDTYGYDLMNWNSSAFYLHMNCCCIFFWVRRSRHKVTGLQGLCALNALELENLVIMPTIAPVTLASTPWTATKRLYETSKDYSAAGRATMALRPSMGASYRLIYRASPCSTGDKP
jgi:hypothetical protein